MKGEDCVIIHLEKRDIDLGNTVSVTRVGAVATVTQNEAIIFVDALPNTPMTSKHQNYKLL